jgi:hypothetical protein
MELSSAVNQLQDLAHQGFAMFDVEVCIKHPDTNIDIVVSPTSIKTITKDGKVRLVLTEED